MENYQTMLISLLADAIRQTQPELTSYDNSLWGSLLDEADAHQVHTLIYPVLLKANSAHIPESLLHSLKQKTQSAAVKQLQQMEAVKRILKTFRENKIPVIALKGLVLRNYYPYPELRTMGDGDLLIQNKVRKKIKKLLKQEGYRIKEVTPRHIIFFNKYLPLLEIHTCLHEKEYKKTFPDLTSHAFLHTVPIEMKDMNFSVMGLSPEDQLIYLLVHFASHLTRDGIGLRSVCDMVLFLEKEAWKLDTGYVEDKAMSCGLTFLGAVLLLLCQKYFNVKLPCIFSTTPEDSCIDLLMEDILSAGVYGRKSMYQNISGSLLKYNITSYTSPNLQNFYSKLAFYFPGRKHLSARYWYAKKLPLLLPAAWVHRGIYNGFRLKSLQFYKEAAAISRKRALLLSRLKLR